MYYDAGKTSKTISLSLGHLSLGVSFFLQAIFPNHWLFHTFFVLGLSIILTSLTFEKLQLKPSVFVLPFLPKILFNLLNPVLAVSVAVLYWRKATKGLEKHLLPLFRIYALLSISEIFALHYLFADTQNPLLFPFLKTYGVFWTIRQLLLLTASILLSHWVFNYLLKRLQTQVFIFLNFLVAIIFITTTFSFSALIFTNLQASILRQTTVETKMFNNYLESQKSQLTSDTQAFTQSPKLLQALQTVDKPTLATMAAQFLLDKHHSSLIVTDPQGIVLTRGENEISGDSITSLEPIARLVRISDKLLLQVVTPVNIDSKLIGTIISAQTLDSAYLSRYTKNTDQNLLLFSDSQIVASSFRPESLLGLKTPKKNPSSLVLLGQDYFASYLPLTDQDNLPLGNLVSILSVTSIVDLATNTLRSAFLIILALEIIFLFPSFLIARFLEKQYK